jgi:hypothetical protein
VRKRATKGSGGKPVLVGEGEELGDLKESGGKQIEGKNVSPCQKLQRVDEEDESADIEKPEGGEGETESKAEL